MWTKTNRISLLFRSRSAQNQQCARTIFWFCGLPRTTHHWQQGNVDERDQGHFELFHKIGISQVTQFERTDLFQAVMRVGVGEAGLKK